MTRIEIPDQTVYEIARMFFSKMIQKCLIPGEGLTIQFVANMMESNMEDEWKAERNGHIADLLLKAVRTELKNKLVGGDAFSKESVSPRKLLAQPGQKLPINTVEEILVTCEDVQSAIVGGL